MRRIHHIGKELSLIGRRRTRPFALIRKAVDTDSLDGILRGGKVDLAFKRNIK